MPDSVPVRAAAPLGMSAGIVTDAELERLILQAEADALLVIRLAPDCWRTVGLLADRLALLRAIADERAARAPTPPEF